MTLLCDQRSPLPRSNAPDDGSARSAPAARSAQHPEQLPRLGADPRAPCPPVLGTWPASSTA
ncbi:hypothetical protein [Streptomyces radicis]|uniref:hypothetical protein n=1 Tax=Streptomyces radicis TaxID=1750517 RepID=UPI0011C46C2C|nr:hypothetical protein [Streptomyces radicis]